MAYLIVFLGAGFGGALRHGINNLAARFFGITFPMGTLIVNIVGSFAMGALAAYFAFRDSSPQAWRLFLTVGLLGGFTTFSAFSLDTVLLYERGAFVDAAFYIVASIGLSVAGLCFGLFLGRYFLG